MKTITTIILLLCSIVVYGQNGTLKLDTANIKHSLIFTGGQAFKDDFYTMRPSKPAYYFTDLTPTK